MAEVKTTFSPEQETAISTRDRTLLVSAAAGSGKTTTLTERIIRSLLDPEKPESIQNMLIVTFTNASVYDLKEKIGKALTKAVNENPQNKRLERELRALECARIMTIDSFCAEVVRTYAERLGITPIYRISEGAEALLIERTVLNSLIDAAFEGELAPKIEPEDFEILCDALTGVKNTADVADILLSLYEKTKSSVRGCEIFSDFAENYRAFSKEKPESTFYGHYLMKMTRELISYHASLLPHYNKPLLESDDPKQLTVSDQLTESVNKLLYISKRETYEEMRAGLLDFSFPSAPSFREEKPVAVTAAIKYRDGIKDALSKLKEKFFSYTNEEWQELYLNLGKRVKTLSDFLTRFSDAYFEEKRRRGILEFSDIERLSYNLLWKDGEITDVARAYREIFTSVYIDEYQDVNELQNKIFEAVSPTHARFMVGDIKQSIYGFRSARPEIFADMKKTFPRLEDGKADASSIFMSNNYRCDEGIVDFVNDVFAKLFGLSAESIGYVKADELKFEKKYDNFVPEYEKAHVCLLMKNKTAADTPDDSTDENEKGDYFDDTSEIAPRFIAKKIKELIESHKRRDGSPIYPKDIAIITRTKKRLADYRRALLEEGIDAVATEDRDFFLNKEILLTLSLLNTIDNPRRDIHLAALLCSPLYSFTPDELYQMRSASRSSCLYEALIEYQKCNPNFTKLKRFLDTLHRYRLLAEGIGIDELLIRLYRESGLLAIASKNGGKENLQKLYSYAKSFEAAAYKGLYSFIAYINSVIEKGDTINKSEGGPSADSAVHIGTIHSAKGLEFPVVFLADASNTITNLDNKNKIAFDENFGISFLLRAPANLALVENPIQYIVRDFADKKYFEEIHRLLYVALTRPKEKLYVVGLCKEDAEEYLEKMELNRKTLTAYSKNQLKTYMDMILSSTANADVEIVYPEEQTSEIGGLEVEHPAEEISQNAQGDTADIKAEIKRRFEFSYPNKHLTTLPEKLSVSKLSPSVLDGSDEAEINLSDLNTQSICEENSEHSDKKRKTVPAFISGTPADISAKRGIATHNFMQFFDIDTLTRTGARDELKRLEAAGFLSEKSSALVRMDELLKFEKSELFESMKKAKSLYREFRFNTYLPASLFTEDTAQKDALADRLILVQGVIDCIIENEDGSLRLIDYKTDRLTKEELCDEALATTALQKKHKLQLFYYSLAVEKIFGKKPTRVEVYSLQLGKTVSMI
ncbi:MAG: UvrD-helicase domain-containing protein [Clostridia bacterium]|nr:UvrD-helicase domain-containing protein [Clostridia bacterium]